MIVASFKLNSDTRKMGRFSDVVYCDIKRDKSIGQKRFINQNPQPITGRSIARYGLFLASSDDYN